MKRIILVIIAVTVFEAAATAVGQRRAETKTGMIQAGRTAAHQVPKFQVDPSWPKLPSKWIMGIVSSVAVDSQDHMWVLQRPLTLEKEEKPKAAPPVLEFDQAGNFVQGWGGPGEGYNWPESEHGIYVDPRGFVWLGGQGEQDQVLKFTKAGKFVMEIGRPNQKKTNQDTKNFWKPADVFVYQKTNELFVADGYGNKRVIVFDADSGAFKRMWGAFGYVPADGPTLTPEQVVRDWRGNPNGPPQFVNPVHAVKVSNDGLVYVGDRGGGRVQVFTPEGKFLRQVAIPPESEKIPVGQECKPPQCTFSQTAAGVAFSPDPQQQFLYVANRSQARVMVFDRQTLELLDSWGGWGSTPGQFGTLHHLAVDSKGNIYTAEVTPLRPINRRAQKFTFQGISTVKIAGTNQ